MVLSKAIKSPVPALKSCKHAVRHIYDDSGGDGQPNLKLPSFHKSISAKTSTVASNGSHSSHWRLLGRSVCALQLASLSLCQLFWQYRLENLFVMWCNLALGIWRWRPLLVLLLARRHSASPLPTSALPPPQKHSGGSIYHRAVSQILLVLRPSAYCHWPRTGSMFIPPALEVPYRTLMTLAVHVCCWHQKGGGV